MIGEALERNRRALAALLEGGDEALAVRAPRVSAWSVGEQLDHMLLVNSSVVNRVLDEPQAIAAVPNLVGYVLLGLGWFPRGVAKSPPRVVPTGRPAAELRTAIAAYGEALERLARAPHVLVRPERIVLHPRFGGLTGARALRFADVHDRHHLKIVRDIQRQAS